MKTLAIVSFIIFQTSLIYTQAPTVVGDWKFYKFETTEKLEEESKAMLIKVFSTVNYNFKSDATYDFQMGRKKESGTWKSDKDYIKTTNSKGVTESIKYIQKYNDTLKLELEKNQYVVFIRK